MPEEKGLGSKFLGLFVESKDAAGGTPDDGTDAVERDDGREKTPAEIVAELAGQSAGKKGVPLAQPRPVAVAPVSSIPKYTGPVTAAQVDFDAVFKTAGMDTAELERVRKAEELLKSLPEATPVDIKRQIVEASLKAFGFELSRIVSAAQNQLKALETYVRLNEQQTAKAITDAQAQIAQLEDKVISLKAGITSKTEQLASVAAAADERKGQVHRVLEFFNAPAAPAAKP